MKRGTALQGNFLLKLLLFFVVLAAILFVLLDTRKKIHQNQHLQVISERYQRAYNTIYDQYLRQATTLYSGITKRFDIPGIYQKLLFADEEQKAELRRELLALVEPRYQEIKREAGVRQFHFHLPNNDSFLRLHRPFKYGDNLTEIRPTIASVNRTHLPIDGFEEGKIYNGFRFVFPIRGSDQNHLGSMEISFGPGALVGSLMKEYDVLANFLIRESTVSEKVFTDEQQRNYEPSPYRGYLLDKEVVAAIEKVSHKTVASLQPQQETRDRIYSNAHSGQARTVYDSSLDIAITTIPITNPVTEEMVGFLTIRSQTDFFRHTEQDFILELSLALLLLFMVLSFVALQRNKTMQLEKERQRLLKAQKTAQIGDWELDLGHDRLHWSEQVYHIFGLPLDSAVSHYQTFLEMVHPDDREFVRTAYSDSVNKQLPYDIRHRIISTDGREKWVREVCSTEFDEQGVPLRSLGIVHDITRQHSSHILLQQERDMFLNGPVTTYTWKINDAWLVEHISANVKDLLGITAKKFLDGSVDYLSCIHPDDVQRVRDAFADNASSEAISFIHEPYRLKDRNGNTVWVLDSCTLIQDSQEHTSHYRGYLVDISHRVRMEEEIAATQDVLEKNRQEEELKRLKSLKTMAGAIAHRFNNSMMVVEGNLQLMEPTLTDNSAAQEMARDAMQAARGASQVGTMMLSYVGQQHQLLREDSFSRVVTERLESLQNQLYPGLELQCHAPDQPLFCMMDRKQIEEVVESLFTNALEALEEKSGTIRITFGTEYCTRDSFPLAFQTDKTPDSFYAFCQIEDNGHGISGEDLRHIFEPFYTTRFIGRGLGLALTVGIMQAHRGAIMVDSTVEQGTRVKILLPSIPPPTVPEEPGKTVQLSGNLLLVDDEALVLRTGKKIFETIGFTVHTAVGGREAVALIRDQRIDFALAILDIAMPEMDGIEAMQRIRQINPQLPIVLSSGHAEENFDFDEQQGEKPDDFFVKPFKISDVEFRLGKLLE